MRGEGDAGRDAGLAALIAQGEVSFRAGRLADALEAFDRAARQAPASADVHCNRGAVYWALGQTDAALGCFRRALECAPDHSEAAVNLARALAALGRREEAASVAQEYLGRNPGCAALLEFTAGTAQARADVAVDAPRRLRIAVFSTEPDWACLRLRLKAPLGALAGRVEVRWGAEIIDGRVRCDPRCIEHSDLIVLQRLFPGPETSALCAQILASGRPVIYELDDDFLYVPATHPFRHLIEPHLPFVREMLGAADALTVSSEALAERVRPLNASVHVLPNAIEESVWGGLASHPKNSNDPVVIGFSGTPTHREDLAIAAEALRRIRAKYGARVGFRFFGCAPAGLEGAGSPEPFDLSYEDYARKLAGSGIDIGIAPLVDDVFNRSKSDIKWLEYSACGFAGVYSDLPAYRGSVRDGETGLLVANTTEAWFAALDRLVSDPALRQRIAREARAEVFATRTVEALAPSYLELYTRVARAGARRTPRQWKPVSEHEAWWRRQCHFREGAPPPAVPATIGFHLLVSAPPGSERGLAATLASLAAQRQRPWRVTVLGREVAGAVPADAGLALDWAEVNGEGAPAPASLVERSVAQWVGFLDAGCVLEVEAFARCEEFIRGHPACRLLYTDEDRVDAHGNHDGPRFKPDFNLELLRAMPYIGSCIFLHREQLPALGGSQVNAAAQYDRVLRLVEKAGPGAVVGHLHWILLHRPSGQPEDIEADPGAFRRVVEAHLRRVGIEARVREGTLPGTNCIEYAPPPGSPGVDILVDGECSPEMLAFTLTHLAQKTAYPRFRVVVALPEGVFTPGGDVPPGGVQYLSYGAREGRDAAVQAWAARTDAPFLLFLRAGVLPLREGWLHELLGPMQRAEVAITAPRLVSSEARVVDGGVVLGGGGPGIAAVAHVGLAADAPGYMGRAQVAQEVGAVTDNCLLIRTEAYRRAGGFPADVATPLYRAVDLCRRVAAAGGVIVWTPRPTLLYTEEAGAADRRPERERAAEREAPAICRRWLPQLARDPAYNPNLSLSTADFRPDTATAPAAEALDRSRPRVLGFGATTFGAWKYRVDQPLEMLQREGRVHRLLVDFAANGLAQLPTPPELERLEIDALLFHNPVHDYALEALQRYRGVNDAFVVVGEDDLMTAIPPKNPFSKTVYRDIRRRIRRACELADRLVVTTEPLAEALRRYHGDVRVVPNGLPSWVWGSLAPARREGGRPRVGWAGAQQHLGDLELLREVVEATAGEVDWVFFGMCPDFLRPFAREVHEGVPFEAYPAKLASLALDLAVAPLELNDFNRCKSELRLLEYGVLGWPVVASDIEPYRDAPVCRVRNQARAWIQAIRERIHDPDVAQREGETLRQWVLANGMLEGQLDDWRGVLTAQAVSPGVAGDGGEAGQADRRQGAG